MHLVSLIIKNYYKNTKRTNVVNSVAITAQLLKVQFHFKSFKQYACRLQWIVTKMLTKFNKPTLHAPKYRHTYNRSTKSAPTCFGAPWVPSSGSPQMCECAEYIRSFRKHYFSYSEDSLMMAPKECRNM